MCKISFRVLVSAAVRERFCWFVRHCEVYSGWRASLCRSRRLANWKKTNCAVESGQWDPTAWHLQLVVWWQSGLGGGFKLPYWKFKFFILCFHKNTAPTYYIRKFPQENVKTCTPISHFALVSGDSVPSSGGSKIFGKGERQFISSVLIHRKCAQRKYMPVTRKKAAYWKNMSQ